MIRTKAKSLLLSIMLIMASIIFFGCKDETYIKVESVKFVDHSINLIVGEEYVPEIKILPSYATDRSYTLTSSDNTVLSVEGGEIKALASGMGIVLKVEYNADKTYNDAIVVNVYEKSEQLEAPAELTFNGSEFSFIGVNNAESYILNINGNNINIGNNTKYSFSNANKNLGDLYNQKLECSVVAVGDGKIHTNSNSSNLISFAKMSEVLNMEIDGTGLTFDPVVNANKYDVVVELNGQVYLNTQVDDENFDLTQLIEFGADAGAEYTIKVAASKADYAIEVSNIYDAEFVEIQYTVVGKVSNVLQNDRVISWNFVKNAQNYTVELFYKGEYVKSYTVETNSVTLECQNSGEYSCRVIANSNEENTATGTKYSNDLVFSVLEKPVISASGNQVKFSHVDGAKNYLVKIKANDQVLNQSFIDATGADIGLDVDDLNCGNYLVEIIAYGEDENVLASNVSIAQWAKLGLSISVEDGVLYWVNEVENTVNKYQVIANGKTINVVGRNYCDLDEFEFNATTDAVDYDISIQAIGEGLIFDSNVEIKTVTKLPDAKFTGLVDGVFSVDVVRGANCEVEVYKQGSYVLTLGNDLTLDLSALTAGDYVARAVVTGNGAEILDANNTSAFSAKTFIKLTNPTLQVEGTSLKINEVANASKYILLENGEGLDSFELPYYLNSKAEGDYIYRAKAIGNGSDIIDSDESAEIKVKKLKEPVVTFNKLTMMCTIDCDDSSFVQDYTIYINGKALTTRPTPASNSIDCSGEIISDGQYLIKAIANPKTSNMYDLILASDEAEAQIVDKISGHCDISVDDGKLIIKPQDDLGEGVYTLTLTIAKGTANEAKISNIEYKDDKFVVELLDGQYNSNYSKLFEVGGNYTVHTLINSGVSNELASQDTECAEKLVVLGRVNNISKLGQAIQFNAIEGASNYKAVIGDTIIDLAGKYVESATSGYYKLDIEDLKELMKSNGVSYIENSEYAIRFIAVSDDENTLSNKGNTEFNFEFLSAPKISIVTDAQTGQKLLNIQADADISEHNVVINQNSTTIKDLNTSENLINLDDLNGIVAGDVKIRVNNISSGNAFNSKYSVIDAIKLDIPTIKGIDGKLVWDNVTYAKYYSLGYVESAQNKTVKLENGVENFTIDDQCTYDFKNLEEGDKTIKLQVYAKDGNYLNSDIGQEISVHKVKSPSISVKNGEIYFTPNLMELLYISSASLRINGRSVKNVIRFEGQNLIVSEEYKDSVRQQGFSIVIDGKAFIEYGTDSLLPQNIAVKLFAVTKEDNILLNSNETEKEVEGLLSPTNLAVVKKSTTVNDVTIETFEKLTWSNPQANGNNVSGYRVVISYQGHDYETDTVDNFLLMPNYGEGNYRIKVRALTEDNNRYLHSNYCDELELTILPAPTSIESDSGNIVWDGHEKAQEYAVRIYKLTDESGNTIERVLVSTISAEAKDRCINLSEIILESAVYGVTIQALNASPNISASEESDLVEVVRLPQVTEYCVDDGKIYINLHKFYTEVEITLTPKNQQSGTVPYTLTVTNKLAADDEFSFDVFTSGEDFTWTNSDVSILSTFDDVNYFSLVEVVPDALFITDAEGYTLDIKILGNTATKNCILTTPKATAANNGDFINRLPTPIVTIDETTRGLVNLELDTTVKQLRYNDGTKDLEGVHLYKTELVADKTYVIYMAHIVGTLTASDYIEFGGVKYNVIQKDTKCITLNFNTASYNMYHYYQDENGDMKEGESVAIDLAQGGSFILRSQMLGDDTYYITSTGSSNVEIERYKSMGITLYNGQLKWERQVIGEKDAVYLVELNGDVRIVLYNPKKIGLEELQAMDEFKDCEFDTIAFNDEDLYITYSNLSNKLLEIDNTFNGRGFNVSVRAHYTNNTEKNIILSQSAPQKSITVIPQADISVVDGMLTWKISSVSGTTGSGTTSFTNYQLQVFEGDELLSTIDVKQGDYELNKGFASIDLERTYDTFAFKTGTPYTFKLTAIGNSVSYVSSATTAVENVQILADIGDNISINQGIVKWTGTGRDEVKVVFVIPTEDGKGVSYTYKYTVNNGEYELPSGVMIGGKTWIDLDPGYSYSFQVRAKGDNSSISGFFGKSVSMQRLSKVTGIKTINGSKLTWNSSVYITDFEKGTVSSEGVRYRIDYLLEDGSTGSITELTKNEFILDDIASNIIKVVIYAYHNSYAGSEASSLTEFTRLTAPDSKYMIVVNDGTVLQWTPVGNNKYYMITVCSENDTINYDYELEDGQTEAKWNIIIDDVFKGQDIYFVIKTLSKGEGYLLDSVYSEQVNQTVSKSIESLGYDDVKLALYWDSVDNYNTYKYYLGYTYEFNNNTVKFYEDVTTSKLIKKEGDTYYYYLDEVGTYSDIYVRVVAGDDNEGYDLASQETQYTEEIYFDYFAKGSGVEGNEYEITNSAQLMNIKYRPSASYVIKNNITLSEYETIVDNFSGSLVGYGSGIEINGQTTTDGEKESLKISGVKEFLGLFKNTNGARFENIKLTGFTVDIMPGNADFDGGILVSKATMTTFVNVSVVDSIINFTKDVIESDTYTGNTSNSGLIRIGAIVGYAENCTFNMCEVIMSNTIDSPNMKVVATGKPNILIYVGSIAGYVKGGDIDLEVSNVEGYTFSMSTILTQNIGGNSTPTLWLGAVAGYNEGATIEGNYYKYKHNNVDYENLTNIE